MSGRRLLRPAELRSLVGVRRPQWDPVARRLAAARTIGDLRRLAARRVPRAVFDYTDGAAEDEIGLRRARSAFRDLEFQPAVLQDVTEVDLRTQPLGTPAAAPFAFAPTAFSRMMHHGGECAVASVAARCGIPYTLSTLGTTSPAELASQVPDGRRWFQLYVWRDRGAAEALVGQARLAGFEALVLTVDVPVAGARHRDSRNGLTVPPSLTLRTLTDMALHPGWWVDALTTEPLRFATLAQWPGTVGDLLDELFDPSMTIDDLEWVRSVWDGPLVVKGIQTVADAQRVQAAGADVVYLSNHGGRQLDRAPVPLRLLPEVRDALGRDVEIWLDTGVTNGADVVAGLALGADLVLVGRAYVYGLMAGGERGVERAAQILTSEAARTMALLGARSVAELGPHHVRL